MGLAVDQTYMKREISELEKKLKENIQNESQ